MNELDDLANDLTGLGGIKLKVENYKCFGPEAVGFEEFRPINLIVGRNNAGKSALLDLVSYAITPTDLATHAHKSNSQAPPRVLLTASLEEDQVRAVFQEGHSGGELAANVDHWHYGRQLVGLPITIALGMARDRQTRERKLVQFAPPMQLPKFFVDQLARLVGNPFAGRRALWLAAERNITPEREDSPHFVQPNGVGTTTSIQRFLNNQELPSELVERDMLADLNQIFRPDSVRFDRIAVQRLSENRGWEVFLFEKNKGLVSLSNSGSGLKSIVMLLALLRLNPYGDTPHGVKSSQARQVLLLEELENHLHPALQRRLALFLRARADEGTLVFMTTHSNVTIDLFSRDPAAQIVHVQHDGECSRATTVSLYHERGKVLDDLDVRASDLLQANCIVWVEGPTDRVYFNRWIELWTDGRIQEGAHYQCVFYGGRLLTHLSGEVPGNKKGKDSVRVLNVNRRALVLIDSDRRKKTDAINATKRRLQSEIEGVNGLVWITAGREVEHYIPGAAISALFGKQCASPRRYQDFQTYLSKIDGVESARFKQGKKTIFAERVCPHITKDGLASVLDMKERLVEVVAYIDGCNRSPEQETEAEQETEGA